VFSSRFLPCPHCGESVAGGAEATHHCDPERRVEHQMARMREEVAALEVQLRCYLDTSSGRFETWLAAREVRGHRR
jgi:hypothetical protein